MKTATEIDLVVKSIIATGKKEQTYNLTVSELHTYLIGKDHIVVHNCKRFFRGALRDQILTLGAKGAYCKNIATQVDHVIAASKGGSTTLGNGVPACGPGNASKGAKDVSEWLLSRFGK